MVLRKSGAVRSYLALLGGGGAYLALFLDRHHWLLQICLAASRHHFWSFLLLDHGRSLLQFFDNRDLLVELSVHVVQSLRLVDVGGFCFAKLGLEAGDTAAQDIDFLMVGVAVLALVPFEFLNH